MCKFSGNVGRVRWKIKMHSIVKSQNYEKIVYSVISVDLWANCTYELLRIGCVSFLGHSAYASVLS